MATYDLDQTDLYSLLNGTSTNLPNPTPGLSGATETTIINALRSAGLFPRPGLSVNTDAQSDAGTVGVDLTNAAPGGVGFFLEEGSHATINIQDSYGAVVAAGDGASIQLTDFSGGTDTLVGGAGADTLIGGGMSYLIGGSGSGVLTGGKDATAADTLQGGAGSDTLTVTNGNNMLIGGKGFDTINAGLGDDTIYGESGTDSITTNGGHTQIYAGSGQETINAQNGVDTIYVGYGTPYSTGTGGTETINAGGTASTTINLNTKYVQSVTSPTTAPDGNTLVVFSNGSVTTDVEIKGNATLNYTNKTIDV